MLLFFFEISDVSASKGTLMYGVTGVHSCEKRGPYTDSGDYYSLDHNSLIHLLSKVFKLE